ncbi:MAG: hypothetical protein IJI57_04125 [Flexilinea sp.]|nr:hypothetical protein [Flexilinea sp.]
MYLYDMEVHQFETFSQQINLVTIDGEVINLQGKTARAQVRPAPNSTTLAETMSCSVTPGKGIILFSLSSTQTGAIPVGDYFYDVCIEETVGGSIIRKYLIGGKFKVRPSVTR